MTEYCYFALPADANDEQKAALEDALLNLVKVIKTKVPTVTYAVGWVSHSDELHSISLKQILDYRTFGQSC